MFASVKTSFLISSSTTSKRLHLVFNFFHVKRMLSYAIRYLPDSIWRLFYMLSGKYRIGVYAFKIWSYVSYPSKNGYSSRDLLSLSSRVRTHEHCIFNVSWTCCRDRDKRRGWYKMIEEEKPLPEYVLKRIINTLLFNIEDEKLYSEECIECKFRNFAAAMATEEFRKEASYLIRFNFRKLVELWVHPEGPSFHLKRTLWYYTKLHL